MPREEQERDYLAGTQLEVDPNAFIQVVREAFRLEHNCQERQDIARVLGVDKSRISQIFGDPTKLKAESIQKLLSAIPSKIHRRRIIKAWVRECFGEGAEIAGTDALMGSMVSEKTIRRIDRYVRESRLPMAIQVAMEALDKTEDAIFSAQLLDRAFFINLRMDRPGEAMQIARMVTEKAREKGNLRREATGLYMRARILAGLMDIRPEELEPVFAEMQSLLGRAAPMPHPRPEFLLATRASVESLQDAVQVAFMERGQIPVDIQHLRKRLSSLAGEGKAKNTYQERFQSRLMRARIHLLLGETFKAQELIDHAFDSGGVQNLHGTEICGTFMGKILLRTEEAEVVASYLRGVIVNCQQTQDRYHERILQWDLARVECSMFPPSRPVV